MSNETLGQRIRRLREAHGMTQAALARRLDASTNAINLLEQDRISDPHWQRLVAIAEILDVSLDYLADRTDDPTPPKRARRRRAKSKAAADPDAGAFCPECGVGDGCHLLDCSVNDVQVAHDAEAQEPLRRGRMITQKLLELAAPAVPHG